MKKAVVAIFNTLDDAENAKAHLQDEGFDDNIIDVASGGEYDTADEGENAISRFFKNLFTDKSRQEKYTRVAERNYVVSVSPRSDEEATRAADILDDCGALDIDKHYEEEYINNPDYKDEDGEELMAKGSSETSDNFADKDRLSADLKDEKNDLNERDDEFNERDDINDEENEDLDDDETDHERKIPVMEEKINIGKKKVSTGGVRVRSRIIENPVEENIRLRQENITVSRKKVDRPATDAELESLKDFNDEEKEVE